jgi:hypothetical protein
MKVKHLLEVATKVFINQHQEVKRQAGRKMKRNMDLFTAVLARHSGGSQ